MSLIHSSAPARAIWIAIARPTPPPEPVTSAVRPAMKFDQSRITSDLHDDRDHCRSALRAVVDEATERPSRVAPDGLEVRRTVLRDRRELIAHGRLRLFEKSFGFGRVHPALGDDLGAGDDLAGALVDGEDHHDHTLFRELLP